MNNEDIEQYLKGIEESNLAQAGYAKKQYFMSIITALCSIAVLGLAIYATISVLPKINLLVSDLQVSVENIKIITNQLVDSNLSGMVSDVEDLVNNSQLSLNDAMMKINTLDVETLNTAIKNLSDTIKPLSNFFNLMPF